MARTLIGCDRVPSSIRWLESTIKLWTKINCIYATALKEEDALYWYNERPNIGALAAAAWKTNLLAVEEYAAMKRSRITGKQSGRIDLYIANSSIDACIEAKQCWVTPGTRLATLEEKMNAALRDAKKDDDAHQRIGVVFYTMRVRSYDTAESALRHEIERVREIKPDTLAWCFPKETRRLESEKPEHTGFVWPGVIMALKEA
jgi:hypothetical protein